MARLEIDLKGLNEFELKLSKIGDIELSKRVVEAGAQPLADTIRSELNALPEDKFRHLKGDEYFTGVPARQKKDLQDSLGITPSDIDVYGNANIKVGFDGYGSYPTKKYPKGLPNPLLARAIESGSSVRRKTPFVRVGANKAKDKVIAEMQKHYNKEINLIMKG